MARILANWLDAYLDYTKNTEPRESYRLWCGLSAIASALQRKCFYVNGSETFFTNMYIVLVGPPAARKGTAIRPALSLLKSIGIQTAADESSRQKLVDTLLDISALHTDNESRTYMHSSLTAVASELTVFLGYQDLEFLTIMCKWYDCEDHFEYATHAHGKQEVSNVWFNLLGATTPLLIQSSLPVASIGSGFASRTVFVFEESKARWIAEPTLRADLEEPLKRDLGHINTLCGVFRAERSFLDLYNPWYEGGDSWPRFTDPRLEFYVQRRHLHLTKMAMLFSAARSDSLIITAEDFTRALAVLSAAERKMSETFRGFGSNPMASVQLRLMRFIGEKKKVSFKELMTAFHEDTDKVGLSTMLATLEEMGFCKTDIMNKVVVYTRKDA